MGNILTRTIPSFDPYDIKTELVGLLEDYFQTRNLDTYESGFMGYLTQAQTYLTSDMLFQNTMAYNEAFLNRAILPSSVHNIAAQLDYKPSTSEPAVGYLTVIVAMPKSNFLFRISSGSKVDASGIPYKVKNHYYVVKNADNMEITMQDEQTGSVRSLPYQIEIHNGVQCLVFNVLIWQVQSYLHEFTFENTQLYNFYQESVSSFEGNIYSVFVSVKSVLERL